MKDSINEAFGLLKDSRKVIALTGAGISTSAGIPDFRSPEGLYSIPGFSEEMLSIDYFLKDPVPFWTVKKDFIGTLQSIQPTRMHQFLHHLETRGHEVTVITQNIDGLHKKAGSSRVIEFHGSLEKIYCMKCGKDFTLAGIHRKLKHGEMPPLCECGGSIRPDVVLFGEQVRGIEESFAEMKNADLMVIIGTSLAVAPASTLPSLFGGKIITVNKGRMYAPIIPVVSVETDIQIVADRFFELYETF